MLEEFLFVLIYSLIGILLMFIGTFVVDLVIPCEFPIEIKKGNVAVGYVMAGINIGLSLIIRSAIMSPTFDGAVESLAVGVSSTAIYFLMGLVMLIIGYFLTLFINKKYSLNDEISKGNAAAGIMIFGLFIGISLIIGGVIM